MARYLGVGLVAAMLAVVATGINPDDPPGTRTHGAFSYTGTRPSRRLNRRTSPVATPIPSGFQDDPPRFEGHPEVKGPYQSTSGDTDSVIHVTGTPFGESLDLEPHVDVYQQDLPIAYVATEGRTLGHLIPESGTKTQSLSNRLLAPIRSGRARWNRGKVNALADNDIRQEFWSILEHCDSKDKRLRLEAIIDTGVIDLDVPFEFNGIAPTPLIQAALGYPKCVKILIEKGAKVDQVVHAHTALIAAAGSCVECLDVLLQSGAEVNTLIHETALSATALIAAASVCSIEAVDKLLEYNANVNLYSDRQCAPIFAAMASDYPVDQCRAVVDRLARSGTELTKVCGETKMTPLLYATSKCSVEFVSTITEVLTPETLSPPGRFPVVILATKCAPESAVPIIHTLVDAGLDINRKYPPESSNALISACIYRNPVTIDALLKLHALPNQMDDEGITPLIALAYSIEGRNVENNNGVEATRLLIAAGADVNLEVTVGDEDHKTALIATASHKSVDMMEVLLEAGAKADYVTANNHFALRAAIWCSCLECIALLVTNGASVDTARSATIVDPGSSQSTTKVPPIVDAILSKSSEGLSALLSLGADPNTPTSTGATPVRVLINSNHLGTELINEMLTILIRDGGARVSISDTDAARKATVGNIVWKALIKSSVPLMSIEEGVSVPVLEGFIQDRNFGTLSYIFGAEDLKPFVRPILSQVSPVSGKTLLQLMEDSGQCSSILESLDSPIV